MQTSIISMEKIDRNKYLAKTTFRVVNFYVNVVYTLEVQKDNSIIATRIYCDDVPGATTEINTKLNDKIANSFREYWAEKTGGKLEWEL